MTCTIISTSKELKLVCKNENEPPYPEIKAKLCEKIWELYCKGSLERLSKFSSK